MKKMIDVKKLVLFISLSRAGIRTQILRRRILQLDDVYLLQRHDAISREELQNKTRKVKVGHSPTSVAQTTLMTSHKLTN